MTAAYVPGDGGSANAGAIPGAAARSRASAMVADPAGYPIKGIDVSSWQKDVDWGKVAAAGRKFAYTKATEGTTYKNPYFDGQYKGAKRAGLYSGAYVFARPDSPDVVAQANFFVDNAQLANDGKTLPPMLDIEWPYNGVHPDDCWGLTPAQMVKWLRTFVDQVYRRTGRKMMIYTNTNWWNPCTGNSTAFNDQSLFVASYQSTPPAELPSGWKKWTLWQYSSSGSLPGDQNVFNGTLADLAALAAQAAPKFTTTGDFNGDGNDDAALFYDYGNAFVALWTMNGRAGGFDPPVLRWYAPYWGGGTKSVNAGDFNGDGKDDISLFYHYGGSSVALFTLSANANG
jgi:GH25 family lysozyme M1 (1,4-beta-N-acetylmuramidase)